MCQKDRPGVEVGKEKMAPATWILLPLNLPFAGLVWQCHCHRRKHFAAGLHRSTQPGTVAEDTPGESCTCVCVCMHPWERARNKGGPRGSRGGGSFYSAWLTCASTAGSLPLTGPMVDSCRGKWETRFHSQRHGVLLASHCGCLCSPTGRQGASPLCRSDSSPVGLIKIISGIPCCECDCVIP